MPEGTPEDPIIGVEEAPTPEKPPEKTPEEIKAEALDRLVTAAAYLHAARLSGGRDLSKAVQEVSEAYSCYFVLWRGP